MEVQLVKSVGYGIFVGSLHAFQFIPDGPSLIFIPLF